MSIRENIGVGIMGLAWLAASVLGLVIHVWTIIIAFSIKGLFAAVVTLIFPFLSELYWFIKVGSNIGYNTTYCISIMAYIGLFVIMLLNFFFIADKDQ